MLQILFSESKLSRRVAIIDFARRLELQGYRGLTFVIIEGGVVAVSPATTSRALNGPASAVHAWPERQSGAEVLSQISRHDPTLLTLFAKYCPPTLSIVTETLQNAVGVLG